MTAVSRDGARPFTANLEGGGMTAIDRASGRVTNLKTAEGEIGVDVTADGRQVWLANSSTNKVTVFDTSGKMLGKVDVAGKPDGVAWSGAATR